MSTYDTRFFMEHYYSNDKNVLVKTTRMIRNDKNKNISVIVLHEVYKLTLEKDGREVANLRVQLLEKDFKIVNVDSEIAKLSAEIRHKYKIPMADSIISATAKKLNMPCITDDPHITQIKEIKTKWI